jgi:hypothetical protein
MTTTFKFIYILISGVFFSINLFGQQISDSVYYKSIHTVQLYKNNQELSYPVIVLDSDEKLKLSFDDFNKETKNYCYTIIHCNSNWEPSDLTFQEYAEGFVQNQITDMDYSTNTVVKYIHYTLVLPNEHIKPILSGNYILKIFNNFNEDSIVFTRRFYITENIALIDFDVTRPDLPKYMKKFQQYNLKVTPNVSDYIDLKTEIKTIIVQNFQPVGIKINPPSILTANKALVYDILDSNIFQGINEFRNFDIKSIRYQSIRIKSIEYKGPYYEIELYPDEWRNKMQYFSDIDINGNYYIENTLGVRKDIDADYVMVHFTLKAKEPEIDGDFFVYGGMTDWECNSRAKMTYNLEKQCYEARIFIKQGYYNYQYAYKSMMSNDVDLVYVEGSHYETENDYYVFVYYKSLRSRYERLIGYQMTNSIKK